MRHLAAIDRDVPTGQPVGGVRFEVAYVRRVGPLRDFIRESAVHRAIRAKVPLKWSVRRFACTSTVTESLGRPQREAVQSDQIGREGGRQRGGLGERRAAALWEAGELPQIARIVSVVVLLPDSVTVVPSLMV